METTETTSITNKKTQMMVRMTTDELNIIKAASKSKGMTVSNFVRKAIEASLNA